MAPRKAERYCVAYGCFSNDRNGDLSLFTLPKDIESMVKIQNRISVGLEVLQYFTTREWWFDTNNFKSLASSLNPIDHKLFPMDLTIIKDEPYIESCMIGGKLYCLKEKMENLPKARLQNNILWVLDILASVFFYLVILYWLASYFEPVRELLSYGGPLVRHLPLVGKAVFQNQ